MALCFLFFLFFSVCALMLIDIFVRFVASLLLSCTFMFVHSWRTSWLAGWADCAQVTILYRYYRMSELFDEFHKKANEKKEGATTKKEERKKPGMKEIPRDQFSMISTRPIAKKAWVWAKFMDDLNTTFLSLRHVFSNDTFL